MQDLSNYSNYDLVSLIIDSDDTELKQQAGEQLLKQSPSNSDLRYLIKYTELKQQAWEQLLKQSPSNSDLCYLIKYTELKQQAWEQLLKQSPSNSDLCYLIEYTELKQQARTALCESLGVQHTELPNEEALIKQIAENALARPDGLKMDSWHCGTSHCLAGWAAVLNPIGQKIESMGCDGDGTETAGCVLIPNYAHLFFSDNDTVKGILKTKLQNPIGADS